jgi:signal transduction histidine kinase/CheY-like chemotaxis protein
MIKRSGNAVNRLRERLVIVVCLNVLSSSWLWSQPVLVNHAGQTVSFLEEGNLRGSALFDVAFTTNGTAWIAASDGLHSYDGYRWDLFGTNHGLPSRYVRTVSVDGRGLLWIGTDKGAGTFDGHRFTLVAPPEKLAGPSVRRIRIMPDNEIWFCSDQWPNTDFSGGLTTLRAGQWRTYHVADGLPSDHVYNCYQDSQGRRFVMTSGGVAQFERDRWRKVIEEPIWELVESREGDVYGFTANRRFRLHNGQWETQEFPQVSLNEHPPKSLCLTSQGEFLAFGFGCWTGDKFVPTANINPRDVNPEAIREAPDGAVWCVDTTQLMRWDRRPTRWLEYTNLPAPRFNLPSNNVMFVGPFAAYRTQGTNFVELPDLIGDPERMETDKAGNIWQWSSNHVQFYNGHSAQFPANELGLVTVEGQAKDGQGSVWFYGRQTDGRRLVVTHDGKHWLSKVVRGLGNLTINSAVGDPVQGVWFATEDAEGRSAFIHANLQRIETQRWIMRRQASSAGGIRLLVDCENNRWAYGGLGLYLALHGTNSSWQRIEKLDETMVVEALAGPECAWFIFSAMHGGQSGFGRYWHGQWDHVIASVPLVMERTDTGRQTVSAGAYSSPDGTFCLSGYNLFHVVTSNDLALLHTIILPAGKTMPQSILATPDGTIWLEAREADAESCVLAHRADGVPPSTRISIAPPQVPVNGMWQVKVQGMERYALDNQRKAFKFSWRIDDRSWTPFQAVPADGLSTAGLKPGLHRFEIRAQDEDLEVQTTPTEAAFTILAPPLQDQTWFQVVLWLGVFMIVSSTIVAIERARKLAKVNCSLNQEIAVRSKTEISLQQTQSELQRVNQGLEVRVQERTNELAHANAALRNEITERRRMQVEQQALEAKMQQTQKLESLGLMAGGIAHDFNNMLTSILGNANLALMDTPEGLPAQDCLREVIKSSQRAADLCGQMLAYSGRGRFLIEAVHLSTLVRETAGMLELSVSKRARLELKLANDLPPVEADATQLRQVVMNLVINASEAIERKDGVITVTTSVQRCDQDFLEEAIAVDALPEGDYVLLEVSDNGCGMDAATQEKIFDPFFTTKFTGRGLGLAAVLGIVRGHGGTIRVQSQPQAGTTFTILLPPAPDAKDMSRPKATSVKEQQSPHHHGVVLLVDDEFPVRTVAKRLLERLGFQVLTAKDGQEAIILYRDKSAEIDCVLLDLTMPELDGIATLHELRRIRPEVRAVLTSGYSEHELGRQFAQDGLAAIVQKPFTIEALSETLERVLETRVNL